MEINNPLLIVVDPGHGGYDSGAQWQGRLEKDDNLRLGLAVRDALERQGAEVLMTRDADIYIPLSQRAAMANESDADLFVSLHRNSTEQPLTGPGGVENYIYLTAPEATSGRAAQLTLDEVARVGVQLNRGVKRGNYYVLRRTRMPAMLLEMGFINDAEDNRLFDESLYAYAEAIAKGVLEYFGLTYRPPAVNPLPQPVPSPTPTETCPPGADTSSGELLPQTPSASNQVAAAQQALNQRFGASLVVDGLYGPETKSALIREIQKQINQSDSAIAADGVFGLETQRRLPTLRQGEEGNFVTLLQAALALNHYSPGSIDGVYGPRTKTSVEIYQRDHFLIPDGVAGAGTLAWLLR